MSYKISIHNSYKDGFVLRHEFDTNSALLHEAYIDAEVEVFSELMNRQRSTAERPIWSNITLKPTG